MVTLAMMALMDLVNVMTMNLRHYGLALILSPKGKKNQVT